MKVKEKSEKVGLKLNIQKTKIMESDPITSRQIDGETVANFIFGAAKSLQMVTASHEIKRHLLLGRKVMTNLDTIDGSPPGSPVPGILQVRILEWVAISFSNMRKGKVKVKSLSRVRL